MSYISQSDHGQSHDVKVGAYGGEDADSSDCSSVAITVSWKEATLKVAWLRDIKHDTMTFDLSGARREVGGPILLGGGEPIQLQIFLDHSALEVRYMCFIIVCHVVHHVTCVVSKRGCVVLTCLYVFLWVQMK